jgi:hypothetical protein
VMMMTGNQGGQSLGLQLNNIDRLLVSNIPGPDFADSFFYLPADGTKGGILLIAHASFGRLHDLYLIENVVIASVLDGRINTQWTITGVYGPKGSLEKLEFLRELKHIKALAKPQWLILGDFNMITRAQDKSNGRTDIKLIFRFAKTLNQMEVRKVKLVGKKYT